MMKSYGLSKCIKCNKEFKKKGASQLYCSVNCRSLDYRKIITKKCKNCNKDFEVIGNNNTYCTNTCKDEFFNKKYKPKKVKEKVNCIICNELFEPFNTLSNTCSDPCRKKKKSSKWRRNIRLAKPKTDNKSIYKDPKYHNVKFSSNEDRAISILKSNGFTSEQIGEVTGRKSASIKNRGIEVIQDKYKQPSDNRVASTEIIKNTITRLHNNTKLIEAYSSNIVFNKLLENDFKIYKGREGSEFDIVLERNNKLFKVQLKTTRFDEKNNHFEQAGTTFFHFDINKRIFDYFKYKDIDFFIFTCIGVEKIYIIPFDVIQKSIKKYSTSLQFYPHRPHKLVGTAMQTDEYLENFKIIL